MSRLLVEATVIARTEGPSPRSLGHTLRMARWQLHFLGPWFWIASVLLLLLGFLVSPVFKAGTSTMLIIMLPLTAILSVVYALRTLGSGVREVEASCPTSIVEMLAGLVVALVCFDGFLGLIATVGIALAHWTPFWALLAAWLSPLLLLVGISFPLVLRWGTLPAIVVGGGPWVVLASIAVLFPDLALGQFLLGVQTSLSLIMHLVVVGLGTLLLLLLFLRGSTWQRLLVQA